jgi:hypothetical protein
VGIVGTRIKEGSLEEGLGAAIEEIVPNLVCNAPDPTVIRDPRVDTIAPMRPRYKRPPKGKAETSDHRSKTSL